MIENIRKYKGLIILGLVVVAVALVIGLQDVSSRSPSGGLPYLKISGRTYDSQEFQNLGGGAMELTRNLVGDYRRLDVNMLQFLQSMVGNATGENEGVENFFVNRMLIREAKEEFGVHPGDEEISDYIRGLRAFAGPDQEFDQEAYSRFVKKGIGRLGLTENDLRNLVSDALAVKKIASIVGTGLGVNRDVLAQQLALDTQQIEGEIARLEIDPYKAAINPTEEEIKAYWELIQDSFTTEPLRKFSYIIATPNMPADDQAENKDAAETIAEAAMTDEQKAAAEKKKAEEKAVKDAELAEKRRKAQMEIDSAVDDFTFTLEEQKGEGFEELAAKNGWEVKTTELFPQSKAPAELDVNLRASSRGGKAVDELFKIEPTSDPISKLSQPIAIGENQWIVARLDGEEKSRPKTFEEAKDEARVQYIAEKAAEALKKAADEAAEKIKAALASGKSFTDAAKEAGIEETKSFTKVTSSYRPDNLSEPSNLFEATRNVDPGTLTEPIVEAARIFLVYVAKREVVKDDKIGAGIDAQVKSTITRNETLAFSAWIAARTEAAKVERLYRR